MSLEDAEALAPELKLSKVLGDLVPSHYKLDRLIVMSPDYLKALSKILSETPEDTLHTYFLWKTIQSLSGFVEADAVAPIARFKNELSGQVKRNCPQSVHEC
jgi:endothelin-converting enzyme